MEDNLSSKECHVWTLSDFIERRKDWDQGDEARLAEYLEQLSNKITQGAKNTLNELDDLVASIDGTAIQVANINNEFQLLADKQFIENKVQEEDETVHLKVENSVEPHEINNDRDVFVNNLKETLKNSFKAIDNHFEKITVVVSDSDDDELKHEETILRPKIFYKKLNLPSLSGKIESGIAIDIDSNLSSDSDFEPPMDRIKDQESFSSDDVAEEDLHFMDESKSSVEPNHQTVDNLSNIEPEKFKPKNTSSDIVYVENDLFSPPPLLSDNDEDDLVNEYNLFSNGSNMFGERNLWDDNDDDDIGFEPSLPIHTDEPPQRVFKSDTQEKIPSIQQTLNDELQKRFHKDKVSSSSDNQNFDSPKIKLPEEAVNVLSGTNLKSPSPSQNIKQITFSQTSKNVVEQPTQYNTVSDVRNDINTSKKLYDHSSQISDTSTHTSVKEEIKSLKKPSLFEQESDDEDLFAIKTGSKTNVPKQSENLMNNAKESKAIFSVSDEEFMDSKSTTKEILSHSIDNSTKLLDSSSDDDLFSIKYNNKSVIKQELDETKSRPYKSKSLIEEKKDREILNKELINEQKNNSVKPSVLTCNKNIENESILNNNSLSNITVTSSMANKSKKLSYLFSSDEDDDIFFDVDTSYNKSTKEGQSISNSTILAKNRNEKYGSKVELFDSSSDDEIFNTNKSNNFVSNINKTFFSNEDKDTNISKSLDDHDTINQIIETKNIDKKSLTENKLTGKTHTNIFSSESDDNDDDYSSYNANTSDTSKILSNTQNRNDNVKSMSLSSEEYTTPLFEPQKNDIFNNFPSESVLNSKNQKSFNEKETDTPQHEVLPSLIENIEVDRSIFSSSDDEQQISFNSTIINVEPIKDVIQSNLNSSFKNVLNNTKQESIFEKEINTSIKEILPTSSENIQKSFGLTCDEKEQLSFNSNMQNKKVNSEIKPILTILDSPPENLTIVKNLESLNEKKINTTNNEIISSSTENKIQDRKSLIFSSSEDELTCNSNIQNETSNTSSKVIRSTSDPKISLKDSVDGSSLSSLNSKVEKPKKIPGKLSLNAGAFINVAGLLPSSKNPIIKPKISPTAISDVKDTDLLPTSETKLFSAEKERVRIQVKRRPPSRKARQLAIAQMASLDIDRELNLEDSSCLNTSKSFDEDFVDFKSSPILQVDNIEIQNKIEAQSNIKLVNNVKISEKKELLHEVIKKNTLDLFDDDSDPFESMHEDISGKDFLSNNTEAKTGEKQLKSRLLFSQHLDSVVNEKQSEIESDRKKFSETESKHFKEIEVPIVKENEENNFKPISESSLIPTKSSSLFDNDEDIPSVKSEKVSKPPSNLFDSDDEIEFSHKFTKKTSVKTKSIFDDDSDDDLFGIPSKPASSNLSQQKQIDNLSRRQNRSGTDGYVKLTAESVAVNPLNEFEK